MQKASLMKLMATSLDAFQKCTTVGGLLKLWRGFDEWVTE